MKTLLVGLLLAVGCFAQSGTPRAFGVVTPGSFFASLLGVPTSTPPDSMQVIAYGFSSDTALVRVTVDYHMNGKALTNTGYADAFEGTARFLWTLPAQSGAVIDAVRVEAFSKVASAHN